MFESLLDNAVVFINYKKNLDINKVLEFAISTGYNDRRFEDVSTGFIYTSGKNGSIKITDTEWFLFSNDLYMERGSVWNLQQLQLVLEYDYQYKSFKFDHET